MPHTIVTDENLYNINNWSDGYFQINAQGNIEVKKHDSKIGVELQEIINKAHEVGLQLPLLIRFADILHDRIRKLYEAFAQAIIETNYTGSYQLVYPIKVNQEYCVVKELLKAPSNSIGLEAGSKPELMAVIGLLTNNPSTIICNGYKDSSYVRAALIAQQMGHNVFIIIEKRSELDIILREATRLNVKPKLGVRIRLVTKCAGKWENTGGAKSKFGLNAAQILDLVQQLQQNNFIDCLQLMHCHLGSQIANIHDIRSCMKEVSRYYVELRSLNAPINTIDVGGGLGVDYAGTSSNTDCSMNYNLKEYAANILLAVRGLCQEANLPEPNIISESGRALTAHHAVLVTSITDAELVKKTALPIVEPGESRVIHDILDTYQVIAENSPAEIYHYAENELHEANAMFKHGVISLTEKAKVEQLHTNICLEIQQKLDAAHPGNAELIEIINERLAAKIFCNLSFFQSIPDAWAIGQIFPIMPISHLNEPLSMCSILQDLTCDSDGTLKHYTGRKQIRSTLRLPVYDSNSPYALGFFLVGAYQEILGNLHNLFGDTNSLEVKLTEHGSFEINNLVDGDTISNVLNLAHYDTKKLFESYKEQLDKSSLPTQKKQSYLDELKDIFSQLTYLESAK